MSFIPSLKGKPPGCSGLMSLCGLGGCATKRLRRLSQLLEIGALSREGGGMITLGLLNVEGQAKRLGDVQGVWDITRFVLLNVQKTRKAKTASMARCLRVVPGKC